MTITADELARVRFLHGDCLDVLRTIDACSVDAVVTDPPDSIGVEAEAEYLPLIEGRVRWAERQETQMELDL